MPRRQEFKSGYSSVPIVFVGSTIHPFPTKKIKTNMRDSSVIIVSIKKTVSVYLSLCPPYNKELVKDCLIF